MKFISKKEPTTIESITRVFTSTLDQLQEYKVDKLIEAQSCTDEIVSLECQRTIAEEEAKKAYNIYEKLFEIIKG